MSKRITLTGIGKVDPEPVPEEVFDQDVTEALDTWRRGQQERRELRRSEAALVKNQASEGEKK